MDLLTTIIGIIIMGLGFFGSIGLILFGIIIMIVQAKDKKDDRKNARKAMEDLNS